MNTQIAWSENEWSKWFDNNPKEEWVNFPYNLKKLTKNLKFKSLLTCIDTLVRKINYKAIDNDDAINIFKSLYDIVSNINPTYSQLDNLNYFYLAQPSMYNLDVDLHYLDLIHLISNKIKTISPDKVKNISNLNITPHTYKLAIYPNTRMHGELYKYDKDKPTNIKGIGPVWLEPYVDFLYAKSPFEEQLASDNLLKSLKTIKLCYEFLSNTRNFTINKEIDLDVSSVKLKEKICQHIINYFNMDILIYSGDAFRTIDIIFQSNFDKQIATDYFKFILNSLSHHDFYYNVFHSYSPSNENKIDKIMHLISQMNINDKNMCRNSFIKFIKSQNTLFLEDQERIKKLIQSHSPWSRENILDFISSAGRESILKYLETIDSSFNNIKLLYSEEEWLTKYAAYILQKDTQIHHISFDNDEHNI